MTRHVRLVVCDGDEQVLGALDLGDVEPRWWQEVAPVVDAAAARGAQVRVLRLLSTSTPSSQMGGDVTYLAELVGGTPALDPAPHLDLPDDPHRPDYARPGGLARVEQWADGVLTEQGITRTGALVQQRTWNLSSVATIETDRGLVWCKTVPPMLAHEGAVIAAVAQLRPGLAPELLGADRRPDEGTVLLADLAAPDAWDPPTPLAVRMVHELVALQSAAAQGFPDVDGLVRWDVELLPKAQALAARHPRLGPFVEDLPRRLARVEECGLPATLVHGDCHPGNWVRSADDRLVLLDWGDSGWGHPLLDQPSFVARLGEPARAAVEAAWTAAWLDAVPGSDPVRAADLLRPVAALRLALVYDRFLAEIEPTERVYHRDDVPEWVQRTRYLADPLADQLPASGPGHED